MSGVAGSRPRPPKPGTLKHFKQWAEQIELDTGEMWKPEKWQLEIVKDILAGKRQQIWIVIPQGNGKTTLMAAVALYHLDPLGWGIARPMAVVAAATSDQALWLYMQASSMVRDSEFLRGRFVCQEGFKRIKLPEDTDDDPRGRLQIWAGDDKSADGAIYTLGILDELHNHRDLRLYRRWRGKLRKRKQSRLVAISTAGEPAGDFEETRADLIRQAHTKDVDGEYGSHIRAETDNVILHDWAVRDRERVHDMKVVKEANPLSAITIKDLQLEHDDEINTLQHWLRFYCNIASRIDGVAITPEMWEAIREEPLKIPEGIPTYGGWDHAWDADCAALVVVGWETLERRLVCEVRIFEPPVDEADLVTGLVDLQRKWDVKSWAYDPGASARAMVQQLEKGAHPGQGDTQFKFAQHDQKHAAMTLAAARLDEAIRRGWLRHDGHKELRRHVLGAVKKSVGGEAWRYDRPREAVGSRRKDFPIDALTALLMAHSIAVGDNEQPDAVPLVAARPR